ncbi:MAG: metal ABC transporter permease [Balneolales bacterium]
MIETLFDFFSLQDPNVRYVLAGTILLGISAGVLGCFAVLRGRALVGDAVAHAVLPGVCLAFIVVGDKNPFALLVGALLFGWISIVVMDFIIQNSKISPDASIGMILSVFFGLGVLLLTYIQSTGNVNQSGLDAFLFGQAASLVPLDVMVFGSLSVLIILVVVLSFKELRLVSFDIGFASAIGYPVRKLEFLIATLLVMTITVGLQAVGVVLMASMLIIPAAAARYWTTSLVYMVIIAGGVGALSGVTGSFVSYLAPAMPTGPWMVLSALGIFIISFVFAPKRGELARFIKHRENKTVINDENILKTLYLLEENDERRQRARSVGEILKRRRMQPAEIKKGLLRLHRQNKVIRYEGQPDMYVLSETGRQRARRIVRVHRLWELYLTDQVQIAGDHVHDDAESMEHLITPEIEAQLDKVLDRPTMDPHSKEIPQKL